MANRKPYLCFTDEGKFFLLCCATLWLKYLTDCTPGGGTWRRPTSIYIYKVQRRQREKPDLHRQDKHCEHHKNMGLKIQPP
jgi:hypothetical protein